MGTPPFVFGLPLRRTAPRQIDSFVDAFPSSARKSVPKRGSGGGLLVPAAHAAEGRERCRLLCAPVRFRLVPTDDRFFELFSESAVNLAECARRLHDLLVDFTDTRDKHFRLVECERAGDRLTDAILRRLNSSFVTPFDREDIHSLAEEIDDVADDMLAVSELLQLVPVDEVLPELKEQADILVQMTAEV